MSDRGDRWDWLVRWMWLGWDMGEDMGMYITMGYGCWGWGNDVGRGMDMVGGWGCVLVVGDKIDETCVWVRIENWKYM